MAIRRRTFIAFLLFHLLAFGAFDAIASSTTFTYGGNGNRTSKTHHGVATTYRWDLQSRLVEVVRNGTWIARYTYDTEGRRVEKLINLPPTTRLTRYIWEGNHVIREINAVGNTLATYEWDENRLLTSKRGGQRFYYQHDAMGSIIRESTADGAVFAKYSYDAWGNPNRTYGSSDNPHLFTGYPFDDETGLHYANQRYYDAFNGGFISVDPAAGGFTTTEPITFHPYLYARLNPLIYTDPDGRTAELQHVLSGFERNRQTLVRAADQLKTVRENANWFERKVLDMGLTGAAVLNAANHVGEGVTFTANAGANAALSLTDHYVTDLGRAADASNRELREAYDVVGLAAQAAWEDPSQAAARAGEAFASPYVQAYKEDTRSQLDLALNFDPRRIGTRVLSGMSGPETPRTGGAEAYVMTEDRGLLPQSPMTSQGLGCPNSGCRPSILPEARARTYISYIFRNAKGEIVYVGRASGIGSPDEVLAQRLSKGHHVYDSNSELRPEVAAVQGTRDANMGAEAVHYEYQLRAGAPLLNDPGTPPLSSRPSKAAKSRRRIEEYADDLSDE